MTVVRTAIVPCQCHSPEFESSLQGYFCKPHTTNANARKAVFDRSRYIHPSASAYWPNPSLITRRTTNGQKVPKV